jgi:hypothetical protein
VIQGSFSVLRRLLRVAGISTLMGMVGWVSVGYPAVPQPEGGNPLVQPDMKTEVIVADRVNFPPEERRFESASGGFILTVQAVDGWKTPRVAATLRKAGGQALWQRELPHYHGPRYVLVTEEGRVLLVDEWINVVSRYALTLIATDGITLAEYSAEQIFSLLAVPRRVISDDARFGPWITEGPTFSADSKSVLFKAGGRSIRLRLEDGRILIDD